MTAPLEVATLAGVAVVVAAVAVVQLVVVQLVVQLVELLFVVGSKAVVLLTTAAVATENLRIGNSAESIRMTTEVVVAMVMRTVMMPGTVMTTATVALMLMLMEMVSIWKSVVTTALTAVHLMRSLTLVVRLLLVCVSRITVMLNVSDPSALVRNTLSERPRARAVVSALAWMVVVTTV
jgi:hypothetical protein